MPVSNTDNSWSYTGNGATVLFGYHGLIFAETDLKVYLQEISSGDLGDPLALGVDYTVSGVGVSAGGNVDLTAHGAPSALHRVVILREVPADQLAQLQDDGPFPAADTTRMVDMATVLVQQEKAAGARSLRLHPADQFTSLVLPLKAARAGLQLGFDADGALQLSLPGTPGLGSVGAPELAADAVTAPAITSNGVAQQAIQTKLGLNSVSLVKQGGAVRDGATQNAAAAIAAASAYAVTNNIGAIDVDTGIDGTAYLVEGQATLGNNIQLRGKNKETTTFRTVADPANAADPIFDMTEAGGAEGIFFQYKANADKGRMIYIRPATTGGFQTWRGNMISYAGGVAPTNVDYFFYMNGEDAADGIRDITFSENYIFGPVLFKKVVNLGGSGNYIGFGKLRVEDSSNVQLSAAALREVEIVDTFAFLIDGAHLFGPVTIDSLSSGILRTGKALDRSYFTNDSDFVAIETPVYRDYHAAEVKTGLLHVTQLGVAFDDTPGDGTNGVYVQVPDGTGRNSIASFSNGGATHLSLGTNASGGGIKHGIRITDTQRTVFGDADNADAYLTLLGVNNAPHLFTAPSNDSARSTVAVYNGAATTNPARIRGIKGRGGTANTSVANGDEILAIEAMPLDGTALRTTGRLVFLASEAVGTADVPTDLRLYLAPDGSATVAEHTRWSQDGSLQMGGANTVITAGRLHVHRSYTVATAPATAPVGASIYVTNESGGAQGAKWDGTNWRRETDRAIIS